MKCLLLFTLWTGFFLIPRSGYESPESRGIRESMESFRVGNTRRSYKFYIELLQSISSAATSKYLVETSTPSPTSSPTTGEKYNVGGGGILWVLAVAFWIACALVRRHRKQRIRRECPEPTHSSDDNMRISSTFGFPGCNIPESVEDVASKCTMIPFEERVCCAPGVLVRIDEAKIALVEKLVEGKEAENSRNNKSICGVKVYPTSASKDKCQVDGNSEVTVAENGGNLHTATPLWTRVIESDFNAKEKSKSKVKFAMISYKSVLKKSDEGVQSLLQVLDLLKSDGFEYIWWDWLVINDDIEYSQPLFEECMKWALLEASKVAVVWPTMRDAFDYLDRPWCVNELINAIHRNRHCIYSKTNDPPLYTPDDFRDIEKIFDATPRQPLPSGHKTFHAYIKWLEWIALLLFRAGASCIAFYVIFHMFGMASLQGDDYSYYRERNVLSVYWYFLLGYVGFSVNIVVTLGEIIYMHVFAKNDNFILERYIYHPSQVVSFIMSKETKTDWSQLESLREIQYGGVLKGALYDFGDAPPCAKQLCVDLNKEVMEAFVTKYTFEQCTFGISKQLDIKNIFYMRMPLDKFGVIRKVHNRKIDKNYSWLNSEVANMTDSVKALTADFGGSNILVASAPIKNEDENEKSRSKAVTSVSFSLPILGSIHSLKSLVNIGFVLDGLRILLFTESLYRNSYLEIRSNDDDAPVVEFIITLISLSFHYLVVSSPSYAIYYGHLTFIGNTNHYEFFARSFTQRYYLLAAFETAITVLGAAVGIITFLPFVLVFVLRALPCILSSSSSLFRHYFCICLNGEFQSYERTLR